MGKFAGVGAKLGLDRGKRVGKPGVGDSVGLNDPVGTSDGAVVDAGMGKAVGSTVGLIDVGTGIGTTLGAAIGKNDGVGKGMALGVG